MHRNQIKKTLVTRFARLQMDFWNNCMPSQSLNTEQYIELRKDIYNYYESNKYCNALMNVNGYILSQSIGPFLSFRSPL